MAELLLLPNGVITDGYWARGSFEASSGSISSCLSDGSDSTYMRLSDDYTQCGGIYYSTIMISYSTATLPFKARVKSVYPTARAANVTGQREQIQMNIWRWKSGDNLTRYAGLVGGGPMALSSTIKDYKGFATDRFPHGEAITQADVDLLATEVFNLTDTDSRVYACGITVVYDEQPVTEIQYPLTTVTDTTPVVSWNYFDDLEAQYAAQIEIYSGSTLVYASGTLITGDKFHEVDTALADGAYTIKARTAQRWTGPGGLFWSEWDVKTFAIQGTRPFPPILATNNMTGFVRVSGLGYINLLGYNSADFEEGGHPDWYSVNNATVATSASSYARTGSKTMTVVPTGASAEAISIPRPALAGTRYYSGFYVRNAPGTSTTTSEADISFYDSTGTLISTSAGSSATMTNNTFTLYTVTATAPTNTAYAALRIKLGATSGTYLADSAFMIVVPTGWAVPDFSSAPNLVALGGMYETSPNLLSYDNSTIGATNKWTTTGSSTPGSSVVEADTYTSSAGVSVVGPTSNSSNGYVVDVPGSGTRWIRFSGATTVGLTKVTIKAVWSSGTNAGTIRNDTNTGTTLGSFSSWSNGSTGTYKYITVNVSAGTLPLVIVFTGAACQVDSITLTYASVSVSATRDSTQARHDTYSLKVQNTSGATNKVTVSAGVLTATGGLTESSNYFAVTAGETLQVAASIFSVVSSRTFGISIQYWSDLNTGSIGFTDVTGTSAVGSWTDKYGSVVVPATAKYAKLFLYVSATASNEVHYWDRLAVWHNTDMPIGSRWYSGYRDITGPYLNVQYSEDAGVTWTDLSSVTLANNSGEVYCDDYEVAHQTDRIYRAYVIGTWGSIIRRSLNSASTAPVSITLPNVWIHKLNDPAGSIYNFYFDGAGRTSTPGSAPTMNQYAGRDYGVASFGEVNESTVNVTLRLVSATDISKVMAFLAARELLVFRDQRKRRGRGVITNRTITDERWGGQSVTFTFSYAGEQP